MAKRRRSSSSSLSSPSPSWRLRLSSPYSSVSSPSPPPRPSFSPRSLFWSLVSSPWRNSSLASTMRLATRSLHTLIILRSIIRAAAAVVVTAGDGQSMTRRTSLMLPTSSLTRSWIDPLLKLFFRETRCFLRDYLLIGLRCIYWIIYWSKSLCKGSSSVCFPKTCGSAFVCSCYTNVSIFPKPYTVSVLVYFIKTSLLSIL